MSLLTVLICIAVNSAGPLDQDLLQKRIAALEKSLPKARLGVAVEDVSSGARWIYREGERFPMQSTFKLPLGVIVLRAALRKDFSLSHKITVGPPELSVPLSLVNRRVLADGVQVFTIGELLDLTVRSSDNTGADILMELIGGPTSLTSSLRSLGVKGIRVDRFEKDLQTQNVGLPPFRQEWADEAKLDAAIDALPFSVKRRAIERYLVDARDTSTPEGMLDFLHQLNAGRYLDAASQKHLLGLMTRTTTGARRLIAGLPKGSILAHKTGTGREIAGRAGAVNDLGIVTLPGGRKLLIVAFLSGAGGTGAARDKVIADVARAAVAAVKKKKG